MKKTASYKKFVKATDTDIRWKDEAPSYVKTKSLNKRNGSS